MTALEENKAALGPVGGRELPVSSGCEDDSCAHGAAKYGTFSAVMGVRWADLMGFRAGPLFPAQTRCLSAVAQDNEEVQYDHALRRRDDVGPAGGLRAIAGIRQRLMDRFLAAVMADDTVISVADGGGAQDHFKVLRSYFLLGRALHIVQDSFSTFHAARTKPDYAAISQVMSYVCTENSPPHPHVTPGVLNLFNKDARSANGDIVRRAGCKDDTVSCLKPEYVASVMASKQAWLAFVKAHAVPRAKRAEAAKLALLPVLDRWFKVPLEVPDAKTPVPCDVDSSELIARRRIACLKMTGQGEGLEAPFDWDRGRFSDIP